MESEKQRTTENIKIIRTLNVDIFTKWDFVVEKDEDIIQSDGPNIKGWGKGVVKGLVRMEKSYEGQSKDYILGHLYISFLQDSWKRALHAIFGSPETKEEVINGDQLSLLFC